MDFAIDNRWDIFLFGKTFEDFKKHIIPNIHFKREVHEDVKKSFQVIEKLLIHSYYEYEFFDVAANKALQTFEMALKLRYLEVNNEAWNKKKPLIHLIDWFQNNGYFEVTNIESLKRIRETRNHFAHPERHSFGGSAMRQWIEFSIALINDLYEDRELRVQRLDKIKIIDEFLSKLIPKGAYLHLNNISYPILYSKCLFVDNKESPDVTYIAFIYTFSLEPVRLDEFEEPFKIVGSSSIKLNSYDSLEFFNCDGSLFALVDNNRRNIPIGELEEWDSKLNNMDYLAPLTMYKSNINQEYNRIRRNFFKK